MSRVRNEILLALELVALTSFAFARAILSSFGDTPELFVGRGASRLDIVAFGLAVTLVPALVVTAVGVASGALGPRARRATHLGLVTLCAGLGVWRAVHDPTGGRTWALPALAVGAAGGLVVGLLRWRRRTRALTAGLLRWASVGAVVYLVQFLWLSPVGGHLLRAAGAVDRDAVAAATAGLGDDAPPVVFLVFDELPTASLLDGDGAIDRELYPNFAALADDATWYRNHTTVAGHTVTALPALLTGRYQPDAVSRRPDPHNLFTLLGERYEVRAREAVTRLCPTDVCERPAPSALGPLLGDASRWWRLGLTAEAIGAMTPTLPGATGPDRYEAARRAIAEADLAGGERPVFTFHHVLVPHGPWHYTDTGELYEGPPNVPGAFGYNWSHAGIDVGRQRHVLQVQAADALLGQLLDGLRGAGVYDDALVVVTADHGMAFQPRSPSRELVGGNEHEIMWTPLLVKAPGQTEGVVDDGNVLSIDVVPTVAAILGIDLPWEVDGLPVDRAVAARPDHLKPYASAYDPDGDGDPERPDGDPPVLEVDTAAMFERMLASDPVAADGPDAAWRLTDHGDAVGQPVDRYEVGDPVDATVTVTWPGGFDGIDTDEPLPLLLVAGTDLPVGTTVAFALDGTIAGLGEVEDYPEGGGRLVQGMLVPSAFHDGDHELEAFVVTGDPPAPVLAPVAVSW